MHFNAMSNQRTQKMEVMTMKKLIVTLSVFAILVGLALPAAAVDIPSEVTLFKNVNIFDGQNEALLMGHDVLVVKNLIKKIDKDIKIANTYEIDGNTGGLKEVASGGHSCRFPSVVTVYEPEKMVKKEVKVNIIDGDGRKLTPGLIDMHYHLSLASVRVRDMAGSYAPDLDYIGIQTGLEAERVLMRRFTSLRDVGGASWGAKLAATEMKLRGLAYGQACGQFHNMAAMVMPIPDI